MMRKKNYEFRSKFHNFWSSKEFTSLLEFEILTQILLFESKLGTTHPNSKFEQIRNGFNS
jgi:hypothetical protein